MSALSKKDRRKLRQDGIIDLNGNYNGKNFNVSQYIEPLNEGQGEALDSWEKGYDLSMLGTAGTGKTFFALYLALKEVMNPDTPYRTVDIIRSAVETRKQGFVPGTQQEKDALYTDPYPPLVNEIFDRGDAWGVLTKRGTIRFRTTGHLRGITLNESIIIADECQNMGFGELDTIFTRQGQDSRLIFSGDTKQTDLTGPYDKSGLGEFMQILNTLEFMDIITFTPDDVVRSGKIKDYILAKEELGY